MRPQALVTIATLAIASQARVSPLSGRTTQICYDGETTTLTCYNPPDGTPQNVSKSDVQYIASYLRAYGAQTRAGRLLTMSIADAPECAEWVLYQYGTALATAKHIDSAVNSSVLFSDIAKTIDGGAGATAAQQASAIIGCGSSGGASGVQYNASNPAYNATSYPAGYSPAGILIKIVAPS